MPKKPLNNDVVRAFVRKMLQQPYNAITFSPILFGNHKPLIDRNVWVMSQVELMKEIGPIKYFQTLLDTLENPLTNKEFNEMISMEKEVNEILKKNGILSPYQIKKEI